MKQTRYTLQCVRKLIKVINERNLLCLFEQKLNEHFITT